MKRILARFTILLLVATATFWMTNRTNAFDCVNPSAMFDQMAACDDNYWSGAAPYHDVVNNSPNHCDEIANNTAWNQCFGQPNFNDCYDAAYAQAYNACVASATSSFQQAGSDYSSCLWNANNPSCFETMEFCPAARDRANQCEALANEECCAYSDCLNASGVWQCQ